MSKPFSKVILFGKRHREKETISTLTALSALLTKMHIDVAVEKETAALMPKHDHKIIPESELYKHGGLIIVVGGDGSLLVAAKSAAEQNLPVLGINRGRLGFLTDIRPTELKAVEAILKGEYQEETRFLLQVDIIRKNKIIAQQVGLNDAVLLPGDTAHMIEFSIEIDKQAVCLQRADGLIIATPTGSTAYALSGGGPILYPQLDAIVLVPMFPHKLTSRPIVVSADSEIKIEINKHNDTIPRLSCDGQERLPVKPGDSLRITKKAEQLRLIHPMDYQYFATLRSKLQWETKPY